MRKIIDITRDLLITPPYPGDAPPRLTQTADFKTDHYHESRVEMSVHAGTHMDAPLHFLEAGADIASVRSEAFLGKCLVLDAVELMTLQPGMELPQRLLVRGTPELTGERLKKVLSLPLLLIGTDTNSIGMPDCEEEAHIPLLEKGVAILENVNLSEVSNGWYDLIALPLLLHGVEASPCRAFLLA
ncbi:MAG: cyclase family protein [Clostridia bacterium]